MTDKELYKFSIKFLKSFKGVTDGILKKHLKSEYNKPKDLSIIYFRLCESAQNKQMSTKVIGGSINGLNNLGKVLYDFDPIKVAQSYNKSEKDKLLEKIIEDLDSVVTR